VKSPVTLNATLNYQFKSQELLHAALTHRSAGARNNERLEFLGDSILNFVVAAEIYHRRPQYSEGQLTRLRADLVRGETLAEVAREIELGDLLSMGSGELKSGGFKRASILADAVEALIGAVYLDGGFDAASAVVHELYKDRFTNLPSTDPVKDPKTSLQELLQGRSFPLPVYSLLRQMGEAHASIFEVSCEIETLDVKVMARGSSRRKAEQAAAEAALRQVTEALESK